LNSYRESHTGKEEDDLPVIFEHSNEDLDDSKMQFGESELEFDNGSDNIERESIADLTIPSSTVSPLVPMLNLGRL
jgi:hypothetical protein